MHQGPSRLQRHREPRICPARRRIVACALSATSAAATLAVTESAQALPLITLSASVRGLYGSALGDPELDAYGLGFGLRAGVTLPAALYLGAGLDYFVGESATLAGSEDSTSLLQLLAFIGYDAGLGPLVLRPSLGVGLAQTSADRAGVEASEGDLALSPGAELIVGLGLLSVSAEARYNKVFADDADGLILGAGLGFSL